jgi:hypothetical protein
MAPRRRIDLGRNSEAASVSVEGRDPANELLDQACLFLLAAQGLQAAAR